MNALPVPAGWSVVEVFYEEPRRAMYRARRDGTEEMAFVKVARDATSDEAAALRREFDIVRSLRSPNIIEIRNYVEEPRPALFTDNYDMPTLSVLRKGSRLSLLNKVDIAASLARAFHTVHSAGIAHLHLRPEVVGVNPATMQAVLGGFHSAQHVPIRGDHVYTGVPAYMAPEQTGRTAQSVDTRSDLYALGMMLYELFTEALPFGLPAQSAEWTHAHLARIVPLASDAAPQHVPPIIAGILDMLLKKEKNDRYQSAYGLLRDLQRARDELNDLGGADDLSSIRFPLRTSDRSVLLVAPSSVLGRDAELADLLESFMDAKASSEMRTVFISGYSGIGKSSLVEGFRRQAEQKSPGGIWFAAGKCENQRLMPLGAIIQCVDMLVDAVLSAGPTAMGKVKEALLEELGTSAAILSDVIPSVARLIGKSTAETRDAVTARNVVLGALGALFRTVATPQRPLIMCLDDLQWADDGTLHVIQTLREDVRQQSLLLVATYRINEVKANSSLANLLATQPPEKLIALSGLSRASVSLLVSTALGCAPETCGDITDLCFERTSGNPFFIWSFLQGVQAEGLLRFDFERHAFTWDITQLSMRLEVSDNVADVVLRRMAFLPPEVASLLTRAACLGTRVEVSLLAAVTRQSEVEVRALLAVAVESGFMVGHTTNEVLSTCRFLHDKIHEGALRMQPELRGETHLRIATHKLAIYRETSNAALVFKIADQFNLAVTHLPAGELTPETMHEVAAINAQAARDARRAVAWESAMSYALAGLAAARRVSDDATLWRDSYELMYGLHSELIEMNVKDDAYVEAAIVNARTALEKGTLIANKVRAVTLLGGLEDAIGWGRRGLTLLGEPLPATSAECQQEVEALVPGLVQQLSTVRIPALVDRPLTGDVDVIRARCKLWGTVVPAGYFHDINVFDLVVARALSALLTHGVCQEMAYPVGQFGSLLVRQRRYREAYQCAELAINIDIKFGVHEGVGDSNIAAYSTFMVLGMPIIDNVTQLERIILGCRDYGSFQRALHGVVMDVRLRVFGGGSIALWTASLFVRQMVDLALSTGATRALRSLKATLRANYEIQFGEEWLMALNVDFPALAPSMVHQSPEDFYASIQADEWCAGWYGIHHALFLLALNRPAAALEWATRARGVQRSAVGSAKDILCIFVIGASLGQIMETAANRTPERLVSLEAHAVEMRGLSDVQPDNFSHLYHLVNAGLLRAQGARFDLVVREYDQALQEATAAQNWWAVMLANEGMSRLWSQFSAGVSVKYAADHQRAADAARTRWGCIDVSSYMMAYSGARKPLPEVPTPGRIDLSPRSNEAPISVQFDSISVLKAARAISSELDIDRLMPLLLRSLMDASGAQHGCVVEPNAEGGFALVTTLSVDSTPEFLRVPVLGLPVMPNMLPLALVNLCVGLETTVVVSDARMDPRCSSDPFVVQYRPVSIMCAPLLSRGKLLRVVYVQNDLVVGAFSKRRLVVFEGLSSQAAISIENSLLYKELQADKRRLEEARDEAVQANQAKSDFLATMSHEIRTPMNGILVTTANLAGTNLPPEVGEGVEIIQSSGEILLSIIESILDYSNLEAGRITLDVKPMSIAKCLEQCVKLYEPLSKQKGLTLSLEMSPVPENVLGDVMRVRQIVMNLLSNAIKFTEKGFVVVRYSGAYVEGPGSIYELRIMVKDSGVGIDQSHLFKLFKSFSQVDSSPRRRKEGVGLGLVICQALSALMGGGVRVESRVASGSAFYATLRFATSENVSVVDVPSSVREGVSTVTRPQRDLRVLIVDDNKINQKVLSKMLIKLGYTADVASDGVEALRRISEARPPFDLVLMDIFMPEMDGVEATQRIRAMTDIQQPIIVAVTASAMPGDREKFIAAGMSDYIKKPVDMTILASSIAQVHSGLAVATTA